jgi:hypothetical protein
MAETIIKDPKYAGPIGHRANGLSVQEVMLLDNGAVHSVYHDHRLHRIFAGVLIDDFNPLTEKIYTYRRSGKALRDAGTMGRLAGSIELVGKGGEFTDFGSALSGMKALSVEKWIRLLTFKNAGITPEDLFANCIAFYATVNED